MSFGNPPMLNGSSPQLDLRQIYPESICNESPEVAGVLMRSHDPTELVKDHEEPLVKALHPYYWRLQKREYFAEQFADFFAGKSCGSRSSSPEIETTGVTAENRPHIPLFDPEIAPVECHRHIT